MQRAWGWPELSAAVPNAEVLHMMLLSLWKLTSFENRETNWQWGTNPWAVASFSAEGDLPSTEYQ